jgi:general secretion pathway protein G
MSILRRRAFTIIELLVVITLIIILAGLILSTIGYIQNKGARSRAETEIAAMSAALENYRADNGIYPRDTTNTDQVDPSASPIPTTATQFLYEQLSGNSAANLQPISGAKRYFAFKPQMLSGPKDTSGNLIGVTFIRDPFGNSYGYSTMKASGGTGGYNPTFDLWSIADDSSGTNQTQWIKNW